MKNGKYVLRTETENSNLIEESIICSKRYERVTISNDLSKPSIIVLVDHSQKGLVKLDYSSIEDKYESIGKDEYISYLHSSLYAFEDFFERRDSEYYIYKSSIESPAVYLYAKSNLDGSVLSIHLNEIGQFGMLDIALYNTSNYPDTFSEDLLPMQEKLFDFLFTECILYMDENGDFRKHFKPLQKLLASAYDEKVSGANTNQDKMIASKASKGRIRQLESRLIYNDKDKSKTRKMIRNHIDSLKNNLAVVFTTDIKHQVESIPFVSH